jgi:hypothetical protein
VSADPVLARVRKLLALATSPNVHEAASAAAAAQALIERHRLQALLAAEADAADPADPVTDGRDAPLERARRPRRWRIALAGGLAAANGCVAYTAEEGDETVLLVAGRATDREAVGVLWEWLVTRIAWLSATHGAGRPRAWHDAFRIGAAEAIVERLRSVGADEVATLDPAALVRVEPARAARAAAVERFTAERLHLAAGRALRVDGRAYARGRAEGANVPLPPRR